MKRTRMEENCAREGSCAEKPAHSEGKYGRTAGGRGWRHCPSGFPSVRASGGAELQAQLRGRAADITCSACFGKGSQILTVVVWQVNGTNVRNFSEARIWQEQEQNQSSSSALTCRSAVLRIAEVREEDLLQRYDCKAMNLHGWRRRSLRLRRKKPSKECFRGAGRAPAVPAAS
uniref:Interleukin 1 receptor like 1 n=1 Tax=Myotis myotis TaxID=51298 RepID=A0A7J7RSH9_MYOMY|nr:interleukin 1 receptor like 1 [Myotis myotis]